MFDKKSFSEILNRIYKSYSNQRDFAEATGVNRGYLSQYINKKLDNPPSPKILKGIADAAKGITTYDELMYICGHISIDKELINITNSLSSTNKDKFLTIPIFKNSNGTLKYTNNDMVIPNNLDLTKQYFSYEADDEAMSPILGINDIAIIEKTDIFNDGNTCLISLDNKLIIRKIADLKSHIELHATNYHFDVIKLTKKDIKNRNFNILGRVIEAKNKSSF